MTLRKSALTSKALQALLTRIGSASSGTKSTLLQRFKRDVTRECGNHPQCANSASQSDIRSRTTRVVSIDMGIKNLAFCDAEISYPASTAKSEPNLNAMMKVLRWKKLDLVQDSGTRSGHAAPQDSKGEAKAAEEDVDHFSPSVLSKTAYKLIIEEILSVNPDVILIEKQRWRSGGGSAVQQWTLRVNTLEAMLWAVLETVRRSPQSGSMDRRVAPATKDFQVCAVDPKRVGQYWLGQDARALEERAEKAMDERDEKALALDVVALSNAEKSDETEQHGGTRATKKPSRSKAEKSAKIAILRSWLASDAMSTLPSTPSRTPHITFNADSDADSTRQALLLRTKAPRKKKTSTRSKTSSVDGEPSGELLAAEMTKLDDVTDCFLQAAAWVAWESNRLQLLAIVGRDKTDSSAPIDETEILKMMAVVGLDKTDSTASLLKMMAQFGML